MARHLGGSRYFVIDVTAEHIATAVIQNSGRCMIADAIKSSLDGLRPLVDSQTIRWTDRETGDRYIALTPAYAITALAAFDLGVRPEPFMLRVYPFQTIPKAKRDRRPPAKGRKAAAGAPSERRPRQPRKVTPTKGRGKPPLHIEGGTPPPVAALSNWGGSRRYFGMRLAGKVSPEMAKKIRAKLDQESKPRGRRKP